MSILYINQYAGSPDIGMEFRPYYMSREWNKLGYKTLIICSSYSHIRTKNTYNAGYHSINGIDYLFLWGNTYSGNGIARFINILLFVIQLILISPYLALKYKPKAVIASSTHLLDIFPSYLISVFSKAKLVFEIHDIWPLTLMEIGSMSKYHPFVLLVGLTEWVTYKLADKIVSILPDAYKHSQNFDIPKDRFLVVPNGYDIATSDGNIPQSLSDKITMLRKKYQNIIAYAGGIAISNAVHITLDAVKDLKDTGIIFVGSGVEKEYLKNKYSSYSHIFWHDKISKSQVQSLLKTADFSIFSIEDSPLYRYGIGHNKIFDYMYASKPVIQIANLENTVIQKANCGFCIKISNGKSMAKEISKALSCDTQTLLEMGRSGKRFVKKNHDYRKLAIQFLDFLKIN